MPNSDVQKANEGPFDKRAYPPKWAFEPITDEEYERQKTEYESVSTTDRIETKHDPWCDCGICQYCNGSEDKFGDPTREQEVVSLSVAINQQVSIVCTECGDHKWETVGTRSDTPVQDFARTVWKYGWIVRNDMALCPNCRDDEGF